MTLAELLTLVTHPQGNVQTCIDALPDVIGDNALAHNEVTGEVTGHEGGVELDIGRLLAVADAALTAYLTAKPQRRELLITLAGKAVNRALWVSVFDPTNLEHTR